MDALLTELLKGELNSVSLLLLFILGIMTKRFVPWWIHEEVVTKLKEYEKISPRLIQEVNQLLQDREERWYYKDNDYEDDLTPTERPLRRRRIRR